jgi:hypothetical protein
MCKMFEEVEIRTGEYLFSYLNLVLNCRLQKSSRENSDKAFSGSPEKGKKYKRRETQCVHIGRLHEQWDEGHRSQGIIKTENQLQAHEHKDWV